MDDDVGDVAVDEHLARREPDDLVRRHAAVGAADPEVLGRLALRELGEEGGVACELVGRPGTVVLEQRSEIGHGRQAIDPHASATFSPGRFPARARRVLAA